MRKAIIIVLKVIALTAILFACFIVAGGLVGPHTSQASEEAAAAVPPLLVLCFLNTLVLTFVILRSRWSGVRLMAAVFFVLYGVTTVMSQIETAIFVVLPEGVLPRLFLMGAFISAPFSVLAVLALGKVRGNNGDSDESSQMSVREWAWKLPAIAVVYVVLYFTFGYYIAWQYPAVREYYGGTDEGSFIANMIATVHNVSWLVPFQILRSMLWTAFALPVVRMMKGSRLETGLAVALLFSVVMNTQLLLPNPYMPDTVRMAHLIETASSNFIFGFFVGWLLSSR